MTQPNEIKVVPFEKILSIISYFTMGIAGLVLVILAYFSKKKLRYFLNYNISQSILLGVLLAIFKFILDNVLPLIAKIPLLDGICGIIYYFFSTKIIKMGILSFNLLELIVVSIIIYISVGIYKNKIYFLPYLTNLTQTIMKTIFKQ